jgi:hypothetical protein
MIRTLLLVFLAGPAFAAPKIDKLEVKQNGKSPEVEIAVAVTRGGGSCDVRVDFGDGQGRTIDFGLATTRTLKHAYRKGGSYKVAAKGTGKAPCEGAREVALSVAAAAAEKKKAEKKKADKKSASKKKEEPKN